MSTRTALTTSVVLALLTAAALVRWLGAPPTTPPAIRAPAEVAEERPAPPPPPPPAPSRTESLLYRPPPPEVKAKLLEMEEVEARLEEVERQASATRRFHQGADEGRYSAADLNRSVVELFHTVELEPVLDDESMILGLRIETIFENSPLRRAGFREGDLLTAINDVRLYDPAELPALLSRLERDLTLCVQRDEREICRDLTLD